jgi:hypothetical protein
MTCRHTTFHTPQCFRKINKDYGQPLFYFTLYKSHSNKKSFIFSDGKPPHAISGSYTLNDVSVAPTSEICTADQEWRLPLGCELYRPMAVFWVEYDEPSCFVKGNFFYSWLNTHRLLGSIVHQFISSLSGLSLTCHPFTGSFSYEEGSSMSAHMTNSHVSVSSVYPKKQRPGKWQKLRNDAWGNGQRRLE